MSKAAKPAPVPDADTLAPAMAANRGSGRRLRGAIAHYLGTAIVSGQIQPGAKLTGEVENAEALEQFLVAPADTAYSLKIVRDTGARS